MSEPIAYDVSYIIVSWNTRQFLLQCVQSILNDPGPFTREIIVVDNASSDGSPESLAESFPQVQIIRNRENLGFARANNLGIRQSRGRYLMLVNSDVQVVAPCMAPLVEFMQSHPAVGIASPMIVGPDGRLQPSYWPFPNLANILADMFTINALRRRLAKASPCAETRPRDVDILSGCFWIVRRSSLERVGLLDEHYFFYGEDMDWCRRFHDCSFRVVYFPGAKAIHFGGVSSARDAVRFYIEYEKANLRYWLKYHGLTGTVAYTALIIAYQLLRIVARALQNAVQLGRNPELLRKLRQNLACLKWLVSIQRLQLARHILIQEDGGHENKICPDQSC